MPSKDLSHDLKASWFLPLRLTVFLIVFGVLVLTAGMEIKTRGPFLVYSVSTLILLLAIAVKLPARWPRLTKLIIIAQILSEVIMEATVVRVTGQVASPFSTLFLLTIVSAALAYQLAGTLLAATFASISYSMVIWLETGTRLSRPMNLESLRDLFASNREVFYTVLIYIFIFYLVAVIAGYLAEKIKSKERELKVASESLRQVKLETDEILKHLHAGLITVDHFGRIIYFNRAAEKITGFRESQIKGRNCLEAFADRMPQFSDKILAVLMSSQHEHRCELSIADESGRTIPIGISASVLQDNNRNVRGVVGIFQDLSEAKALEEKMRLADRLAAVGELSASIAHEIRNPLASICGSVEVLSQELRLDGENRQLMDLIVKEASRLNCILTDFLEYARVKKPVFNKVELNRAVSDIFVVVKNHPSFRSVVSLALESEETLVYASGDEGQIKQILLNLVVNAVEAIGEEGGRVTVRLTGTSQRHPDRVFITVQDSGKGMTIEEQGKIFTPFFSTKKGGTGLGLAIVKRLLDNLNGKITVESSPVIGTTVTVALVKYFEGLAHPADHRSTPARGVQVHQAEPSGYTAESTASNRRA